MSGRNRNIGNYPLRMWLFHPDAIRFKGRYISNWFSNMYLCNITSNDDGITYKSVENYFQAHKTLDMNVRKEVSLMSPYESKRWAKGIHPHDDWNHGLDVMYEALLLKWSQPINRDKLLSHEGDIVEWNNWNDSKWGVPVYAPYVSGNKQGRNILGCMLIEIRESLK